MRGAIPTDVIVGVDTRFEIWDAATWEAYVAEQEAAYADMESEGMPTLSCSRERLHPPQPGRARTSRSSRLPRGSTGPGPSRLPRGSVPPSS